jgi:hypothetical protein
MLRKAAIVAGLVAENLKRLEEKKDVVKMSIESLKILSKRGHFREAFYNDLKDELALLGWASVWIDTEHIHFIKYDLLINAKKVNTQRLSAAPNLLKKTDAELESLFDVGE